MPAEAEKLPFVFALMPDYVQRTLEAQATQYFGRASWLNGCGDLSLFDAGGRYVYDHSRVRGVRRASEASREESLVGRVLERK